jgi:hypothetical protein
MKHPAKKGEPFLWLSQHVTHHSDDCLEWPFGKMGGGYGVVTFRGKQTTAHRAMAIMAHGEPPVGATEVAHSCGNPLCVNPDHIRHATPRENSADKLLHDRMNSGERNGQSKLSLSDVLAIKALAETKRFTHRQIGNLFGVRDSSVTRIIAGQRWGREIKRVPKKSEIKKALEAGEEIPGASLGLSEEGLMVRSK